jgi:Tol biopolymer transport system component
MIPGRLVLSVAAVLMLQDLATTRQLDLTITEGTSMAAAASPDRRSIAIDLLGGIWILPFSGGEAKRITPELLEARQPTWSPDSQSIAFQGYGDDGAWHIYVIARDGGDAKAITSGSFDDREPAWSHDGARIAFSSDRYGGITTIWTVAAAGGEVKPLSTRDGWMPAWSPNDQEMTFVSGDAWDRGAREPSPGVYAVTTDGHERFIATDATRAGMPSAAAWDPAGTRLAYVTPNGLFVDGARVDEGDVFPFKPQWLSRGSLLYTADGRIKVRTIEGRVSTIPFTAKVRLLRSTYAIAHRALEPVEPQPVTGIVAPVVSPDGGSPSPATEAVTWTCGRSISAPADPAS